MPYRMAFAPMRPVRPAPRELVSSPFTGQALPVVLANSGRKKTPPKRGRYYRVGLVFEASGCIESVHDAIVESVVLRIVKCLLPSSTCFFQRLSAIVVIQSD